MKILENSSLCCGCSACYNICPTQAIEMNVDEEGFNYPVIDEKKCIGCKQCKLVCPIGKKNSYPVKQVYACYSNNKNLRMRSASGGVFTLLAEYIIKNGGVVFGAAFNEDFLVEHICIEKIDELEKIKGSKYIQSNIGDSYKKVKNYIEKEKLVLFSGTACQIAGLKGYLKKDYLNLICVDVVCHGVPSPVVWKKYLSEIKGNKKLTVIRFRCKEQGIKNAPLKFYFSDGNVFEQKYLENEFISGFIKNLYLRESCYQCEFKGEYSISDIMIGDFWGLDQVKPDFGDEYGISLVMLKSQRGQVLFEKIKDEMSWIECEEQDAIKENPCIVESVKRPKEREDFFKTYQKIGVISAVKKLTRVSMLDRIKKVQKRVLYLIWRKIFS